MADWFTLEELGTRLQTNRYSDDALEQARGFATVVITAELVGYTIEDPPATAIKYVALDVAKRYLEDRVVMETIGSESYRYADPTPAFLTDQERTLLNTVRPSTPYTPRGLGVLTTTRNDPLCNTVYVPTAPEPSGYPFPWYVAGDPDVFG